MSPIETVVNPDDVENIAETFHVRGEGANRTDAPVNGHSGTDAALGPQSSMAVTPLHKTALRYAEANIPVFPCIVGGKKPAVSGGFHAATTDLNQINAWWNEADYNVGCEPGRAGWCVVDLDTKSGGPDTWRALDGDKPRTFAVATPGGGRHLDYKGNLPGSAGKLGPGIDTRGEGSYVLVPPSVVDGRLYIVADDVEPAPLPAWVVENLGRQDKTPHIAPTNVETDAPATLEWAKKLIASDLAVYGPPVDGASSDNRAYQFANTLLDGPALGHTLSEGVVIDLMAEEWAPHFDPGWVDAKVESALAYRQNEPGCAPAGSPERRYGDPAGLIDGNPEPAPEEAREQKPLDDAAPPYVERLRQIRDAAGRDGPRYDPPPIMPLFMTAGDLAAFDFPPEVDVWQGLVLHQLVNLLYGDGGSGKTMLAMHLAVACAAGLAHLFGHKVMHMPVLMVLCEDAYKRTQTALRAICAELHVNPAGLPITFCCTPADPLLAVIGDRGEREIRPFLDTLCERIAPLGECLVVLDTASDIAQLNENLRLPPNTLLKGTLQPICDVFGATLIVPAHPSAAQVKSGRGTSGGTSWKNGVRNVLSLEGQREESASSAGSNPTMGRRRRCTWR